MGQRRYRAPRPNMDVRRADGRSDRGVVDVAVVEPRGPKFGGREGGVMKRQSIGKGEVASSLLSYLSLNNVPYHLSSPPPPLEYPLSSSPSCKRIFV